MLYKEFQGLKLSALGMGCMRLPVLDGDDARVDQAAVDAMTDCAMEQGINYYDTAWGYHSGNSERAIGKELARYPMVKAPTSSEFVDILASHFLRNGATL